MSASVKDAVRGRDGFACRDCGMTNEEHIRLYERKLDVHRLLPGCEYEDSRCVTLCRDCHSKKPKKAEQLLFGTKHAHNADGNEAMWRSLGLMCFSFNFYNQSDHDLLTPLLRAAEAMDIPLNELLDKVVAEGSKQVLKTFEVRLPPNVSFDLSDAA